MCRRTDGRNIAVAHDDPKVPTPGGANPTRSLLNARASEGAHDDMAPTGDAARDPAGVPCTFITNAHELDGLARCLDSAIRVAIDTEVPIADPRQGELRVASIATRDAHGAEDAFVVDARDVDPTLLAPLFDGIEAAAWNANFDARVIDTAVYQSADTTPGLRWWDGQLADALLHQGRSGVNWYHGLAWATKRYLGIEAEGKGTVQLSYTAFDDLTDEQVRYSAADAVETLWVCDRLRAEVDAADLRRICAVEMAARPFLDQMERTGLPFDTAGWQGELQQIRKRQRATLSHLASLTGGGQGSLFDDATEPSWNPASDAQVKRALNRWSSDEVHAWSMNRFGEARPLSDHDSVHAGVLRAIGGELSTALLDFRNAAKILSTYGDSLLEFVQPDGRMHAQYLQVVGTNTGRLASRHPNAQNLTPRMKPYLRPADADRVFVHADLSQAELRYLAQVSDDEPLRAAFARGDDVHLTTALTMFGVDRDTLERDDPERLAKLRQIAKALNFGIAYGAGGAALAHQLSNNGTPTSPAEGRELLAQYRRTYPGTTAWAEARDNEMQELGSEVGRFDWALTRRLAADFSEVEAIRRSFRRSQMRWPSTQEIADLRLPGQPVTDKMVEHIEWIASYSAPVVLLRNGQPFTFLSRTLAGRRQQFNLHVDRLFLYAIRLSLASRHEQAISARRAFEADQAVQIVRAGRPVEDAELGQVFEDRNLRRRYIDQLETHVGTDAVEGFLRDAAKERILAMTNAWRNAPIQGGVADIMLMAFADLDLRLRSVPSARPVQTVHDSIVIECDRSDAPVVAEHVRIAMEEAMRELCPDVRPLADVDVRDSLASSDIINDATPA